jgi:hypothetical protein
MTAEEMAQVLLIEAVMNYYVYTGVLSELHREILLTRINKEQKDMLWELVGEDGYRQYINTRIQLAEQVIMGA